MPEGYMPDQDARRTKKKGLRMTVTEFNQSIGADTNPPADLPPAMQALWWQAKGDWQRAHATVQDDPGANAAWVHAFLHRVEGDESNAAYWYARARRPVAHGSFPAEREQIVALLLGEA
jgi:hypothetical protein